MAGDVEACEYIINPLLLLGRELNQFAVLHHAIRPCGAWNGHDHAAVSHIGVCSNPSQRNLRRGDPSGPSEGLNIVNKLQVLVEVLDIQAWVSLESSTHISSQSSGSFAHTILACLPRV